MASRYIPTQAEVRTARQLLIVYEVKIASGAMTAADWYGKAGQELFVLQRDEDALSSIEHALNLDPSNAMHMTLQGSILGELGRLEDALATFDSALAMDPNCIMAQRGRETALFSLEHPE